MKLKTLLTVLLFLLAFFGEITLSYSFKRENDRNKNFNELIPFSHKLSNDLSDLPETYGIDSIFRVFMLRNGIVGASIAVTDKGRLVYSKGFGFADVSENETVTPGSLFRIASVSKLITATAIMKLIEDEKLDIDDHVFGRKGILNDSSYMYFSDKRMAKITVRHLLNHTGGWNGKKADPVFNSLHVARIMDITPPATMPDIIQYVLTKKLDYIPGKKYSYSNLGYCILGEIIEKVTGMKYEEYVQFAILHPLGIYDMHIGKSLYYENYPGEVRYYDFSDISDVEAYDGSQRLLPVAYGGNYMELLGAAGGWISSAPELARLVTALDGFESKPDILSPKTIRFMTASGRNVQKLIGWRGSDGHGTWWRTGTLSGTTALVFRTKNEINWIVLLNTTTLQRSKIHSRIQRTMSEALYHVDFLPDYDLFTYEPDMDSDDPLASR